MTDPMIVDAQASAITGWVGPVPFSVDPQAVIARLKLHYNVVTLLNQRTVTGIKFLEVTYNSHHDLALAISKPSTFSAATSRFAGQGPCPAGRQLPRLLILPRPVAV
ncbi:hypothetical protein BCR44DRAFT_1518066 [Catenaria anguillulae PL171]|uniref:Uncharacterized protein n=1 Tax=Catenaria anguillulae PL171 TaxID=765915 RepID=A0A1Y2H721_9FUNG|nr:hypothetical protein BCR44DRAFT_1518066 [Catenaria anguillulae PL171]